MRLEQDTQNKVDQAEGLLRRLDKINKFQNKYDALPAQVASGIAEKMYNLAGFIDLIENPSNEDEVVRSELKRRMVGEANLLEHKLSGRLYDFDSVIELYGIPKEDIKSLPEWLKQNREGALDSIDRLFHSKDLDQYELALAMDLPSVKRAAEEVAKAHIDKYHKVVGEFLEDRTNVAGFLRDIQTSPSTNPRSYFNILTGTLALGIEAICHSSEDGLIEIKDEELIRLYGHEAMGHALNYLLSQSGDLPYFLREDSELVRTTGESIAQHYEGVLLDGLNEDRDTQKRLGIEHKFDEIYKEVKDTDKLELYKRRFFSYFISVMGDKSLGNPEDPEVVKTKTKMINELALDSAMASRLVQGYRRAFDSEGNLDSSLVKELIYAAQPVARSIEGFREKGIGYEGPDRNFVDTTILTGLWTPMGFVENARIQAENYKSK